MSFLVKQLSHHKQEIAEQILHIQLPAYQIEASIIEFSGIPALLDTASSIQQSTEIFYGCYEENELIAVCSVEKSESESTAEKNMMTICRMVVHPDHFRKGVAHTLLHYILDHFSAYHEIKVHTGAKNIPAIRLYEKQGFILSGTKEVAPNFHLAFLHRYMNDQH
ncbi:GNAT family N-acetyltransferase [Brevibacillus daliensis]|uniref:GNAT family N-acetyltransferase n=1 Tax=Brevibacillus daliensis TaxID=2892995 RepID=UPI001E2B1761|nr:GNAT family N-acetyltransferase [Brevibacillus daliensis]